MVYLYFIQCILHFQSNRVYEAVKVFEWHLMPFRLITNFQIMLHISQQPQILYVAKVKPLNMETSVAVSICAGQETYKSISSVQR